MHGFASVSDLNYVLIVQNPDDISASRRFKLNKTRNLSYEVKVQYCYTGRQCPNSLLYRRKNRPLGYDCYALSGRGILRSSDKQIMVTPFIPMYYSVY